MMSPEVCPACDAERARVVDSVDPARIVAGYVDSGLGVDVSRFLAGVNGAVQLLQCLDCGLKWYAPAPAGDGAFYAALQRHEWYYQQDKAEYGFAAGHIGPRDRVLEVGCGRGAFRSRLGPDVTYRGLEFNDEAVASAQRSGLDVVMRAVDVEASEQPGGYDVVCHFQVLEHVPDPAGFLRDCVRALRTGGRLIVAVPAEDSFVGLAESNWLNMPPHHLTRWPDRALHRLFERLGVDPLAAWHEDVAAVHRAWHRSVVAHAGWLGLQGAVPRLVARSQRQRLERGVLRLPGAPAWLYRRGLAAFPGAARGHTLCMAGVKR